MVRVTIEQIRRMPTVGTPYEFSKHFGVTPEAVYRWVKCRGLPAYRTQNGGYSIDRKNLEDWLRQNRRLVERVPVRVRFV